MRAVDEPIRNIDLDGLEPYTKGLAKDITPVLKNTMAKSKDLHEKYNLYSLGREVSKADAWADGLANSLLGREGLNIPESKFHGLATPGNEYGEGNCGRSLVFGTVATVSMVYSIF
jgi:hypothetical protein